MVRGMDYKKSRDVASHHAAVLISFRGRFQRKITRHDIFLFSVCLKASTAPSPIYSEGAALPSASKDTRNVSQATKKNDYG
jgi:hypothetical protein